MGINLNKAQSYWKFNAQECAQMTREDLEAFVAYELMTCGVLRVAPPKLETVPPEPEVTTSPYFVVEGGHRTIAGFRTIEQAQAFIDLAPLEVDKDYETDRMVAKGERELTIARKECIDRTERDRISGAARARAAIVKANEAAQADYTKAATIQENALQSLYTDWENQRENARGAAVVADTFCEYMTMTHDNHNMAAAFLLKTFGEERIVDVERWTGLRLSPYPEEAKAKPSAA